ncbi:MAG: hypothetical protein DWH78_00095, partial [Planctomycetota bacterium]
MPIGVKCPACQSAFFVKDELAGKRIRCVKCRAVVDVATVPVAPSSNNQNVPAVPPEGHEEKTSSASLPAPSTSRTATSPLPGSPAPVVRRARRITAE